MEKKQPVSIYAEITPNPAVMKFVANLVINPYDSVEYKDVTEVKNAPLAMELFQLPFVKEVFFAKNFVALTKTENIEWFEVALEVREKLQTYFQEGNKAILEDPYKGKEDERGMSVESLDEQYTPNLNGVTPQNEVEEKIVSILEEYIKPSVAMDGGDVVFSSLEDGVLKVKLQGACSGCPSATITLKQGIENLFLQMMPDHVTTVEQEL